eukprot:458660-Rhodomonas_salina.1
MTSTLRSSVDFAKSKARQQPLCVRTVVEVRSLCLTWRVCVCGSDAVAGTDAACHVKGRSG